MRFTTKQIGMVVVLVIVSWAVLRPVQSAEPAAKRDVWEYKVDTNSGMVSGPDLNSSGSDGWELVTVAVEKTGNCTAIYKRHKR